MNAGFILLYRQITEWEWYSNPNTFRVFLHCLLMANFTDGRFEGREIKRGQLVTSLDHLSMETKLTVKEVRTALNHLIGTGELASESCNRYRVITVVKYNEYQTEGKQNGSQTASEGQTEGKQGAGEGQHYKKNNNVIREQGNNHHPAALLDDDDARQIQTEQNRVLDAAEDAGFTMSNNVRAALIALYAEYGLQKMLDGLKACSEYGVTTLAYLRGCLSGRPKEKKPGRILPAQDFPQRSYDDVQSEMMSNLAKQIAEMNAQEVS